MTDHLDALRDALTAARPSITPEQQAAADALLAALTPPMEEPTWPGYVMAICPHGDREVLLHSLRIGTDWWECAANCSGAGWSDLGNPRPLTDEERAEYGIPVPAEPITDDLVERCAKAAWREWGDLNYVTKGMHRSRIRAALRAAGHPEAGE